MNNGTPLSSSDSEMASKIRKSFMKNCHATFDKTMSSIVYLLKWMMVTSLRIGQKDLPLY